MFHKSNRRCNREGYMKKFLDRILCLIRKEKDTDYYRKLGVILGEDVYILDSTIEEGYPYLVTIGNHVTITGADILAHDASTIRFLGGYVKVAAVRIGNNVFIGHGSVVLPGTTIGDNVIVGANTLVSGNVPENSVIVGNPYRIICTYDEYVQKHKQNMNKSNNVYSEVWYNKTDDEKNRMKAELADGKIGYSK